MIQSTFNKKLIVIALASTLYTGLLQAQNATPTSEPSLVTDNIKVNTVKRWFSSIENNKVVVNFVFDKAAPTDIPNFVGPSGTYIAFDFNNVVSSPEAVASSSVSQNEVINSVRWVDTSKKGRAVIEIKQNIAYRVETSGNILKVIFDNSDKVPTFAQVSVPTKSSVLDLQFKQMDNHNGQFIMDISDPALKVKVSRDVNNLVIDIPGASLPRNLAKRIVVDSLDTPMLGVSPIAKDDGTKIILEGRGTWDYAFSQNGKQISIDIFKLGEEYKIGGKRVFTGKKMSISFQNVEVRTLFQIIAEFTGLNLIATDSVGGAMTLKLNDVPWDQALDIIMQSRNLDMRKSGNVIWIAPKQELAAKDKEELDDRAKVSDMTPLTTETFQLNYQQVAEVQKMLDPKNNSVMSKRGSLAIDARTNQLFVIDTPARIDDIKKLIKQVDIAVKQVSIEAKIVEVTESWGRSIGVKFGFNDPTGLGIGSVGNNRLFVGGNMQSAYDATKQTTGSTTSTPSNSQNVSLPAGSINGNQAGVFSFSLFNSSLTKFLNLEVSALEADGKAKLVSSPRVVTADGKDALIEEGKEIPYQQATSSGATSVSFKKAVMSLSVKPKITPDGKVSMELKVNKDSKGETTSAGPAIDTKKVDTTVLVDNGGTIVIGGIMVQEESTDESKIPLLGDIPVIGNAFKSTTKSRSKREMIIMITPRIIEGGRASE